MDGRAQVGTGTLIMFAAMIVVAALAAGTLLGGANAIRLQAQDQTEDAYADIGSAVTVVNEVGRVNATDESVGYVRLSVTLGPGTNETDLRNATIHYADDDVTRTLNWTNATANATNFSVAAPIDHDESAPELNADTDTFHLVVAVEAIRAGVDSETSGITDKTGAGLTITAEDGTETTVVLAPPASLFEREWVRL